MTKQHQYSGQQTPGVHGWQSVGHCFGPYFWSGQVGSGNLCTDAGGANFPRCIFGYPDECKRIPTWNGAAGGTRVGFGAIYVVAFVGEGQSFGERNGSCVR